MIIKGHIDDQNNPWLKVVVIGETQQTIYVIVDTGFTGELMLPKEMAIELGLKKSGVASCQYANGTEKDVLLYSATLKWGSRQQQVTVHVEDNAVSALIGGGLLHNYILQADYKNKQLIIKEPED